LIKCLNLVYFINFLKIFLISLIFFFIILLIFKIKIVKYAFEYKNEDFESLFSLFGSIYEISYQHKFVIIKYSDLKSLKKLEKCLENFRIDPKSQLKFLKNIFLNIPEDFIRRILSKVLILSKENSTDLFMKLNNNKTSNEEKFFNENDKENCPPNLPNDYYYNKNNKKPLKLSSTVFSLSEISSVNDVNQSGFSNKNRDSMSNNNSYKGNFIIDLELIKEGIEKRTTIMIRNIPNRYNQETLLRVIDVNFKGMYDFIYLPMDFKVYLKF